MLWNHLGFDNVIKVLISVNHILKAHGFQMSFGGSITIVRIPYFLPGKLQQDGLNVLIGDKRCLTVVECVGGKPMSLYVAGGWLLVGWLLVRWLLVRWLLVLVLALASRLFFPLFGFLLVTLAHYDS